MRVGRAGAVAVTVVLLMAACGGDNVAPDRATEPAGTTGAPTTTEPGATTPQPTSTTEQAQPVLVPFIDLAEEADASLASLARRINATFPEPPDGLHDELLHITDQLADLHAALPGGLDDDVEAAAVLVYSDLDSRRSALAAMDPFGVLALIDADELRSCFANGSTAAAAFADDLGELEELAAVGHAETGTVDDRLEVEVRLSAVEMLNRDQRCGGFQATTELGIDWTDEHGDERSGHVSLPDSTLLRFDARRTGGSWGVVFEETSGGEEAVVDLTLLVQELVAVDEALDATEAVLGDIDAPNLDDATVDRFRSMLAAVGFGDVEQALPAGLPADVEVAALLVYSDLVSRHTAFENGIYVGMADEELHVPIDEILTTATTADAAFDTDLDALAGLLDERSLTGLFDGQSREAGSLAVRRAFIWLANGGCAQTGGFRAVEPIDVEWLETPADDVAGRIDGMVEGITFTADLGDDGWTIAIHAC